MSDNSSDESQRQRHKQRMQRRKKIVDTGIAQALEQRGVVVVHTGEGKGKTTAAIGTVTRALGYGYRVFVAQFIKGTWECGEKNLLAGLPAEQYPLEWHQMGTGFTWETQDDEVDRAAAQALWDKASKALADPDVYLVVLDELTYALNYRWLDRSRVLAAIGSRPQAQTVVITGRGARQYLLDIADTVSEMRSHKHAFAAGVAARRGIEW
ncbi:cob(I)yrinic acid a,c-diamide adenosyltransferase [Microbulbifer discodermiae]|uniref:cob(I)yrinic acid a,c-diamide adenosyltransferase n=1 Tax=Microbulbifer sp. 2201CG32-9 TaxID=3232309 RepID=UPI00345C05D1